ncbi:adenosylcobinamide-GDP ribazoletransferase [Haloglycomyces albus]|uniref:adenosylcobinamide-GDP ribazoletransferase n=1 Tax=Haloglycomyces albus TaxID=526067 RepID=UPI00046D31CE|nr:adenosylcobinamide-GDP ribazoletransferase [Haloglycomyces albus]
MRNAVGFLTTLPVRSAGPLTRRSLAAFPLVGLVVGLAWAAAALVGDVLAGPLVAAAAILAVDLKVTGGFHLDGVADTADGLAVKHRPDRVRQAIKDSRIGALGSVTATTTLLARFALLATVMEFAGAWMAIAVIPVCGRCASVWMLSRTSSEHEQSLTHDLHRKARGWPVTFTVAVTMMFLAVALDLTTGQWWWAAAFPLLIVVTEVVYRSWERYLSSNGDLLGAAAVTLEILVMLGLVAAMRFT